ncbi:unnamed protein product [Echinostoma caproni]|uniref:3-hydroxy-3-methylglutaryl coenzyme A synthase n=1 Tax=Echinostoma caproni TaxID=27848 RepID=A0A183AVE0_9TREM|nr:unnamed protein product [Echinostoma caproni]
MSAKDVGIHAIEVYFPRFCVKQTDMELSDGCTGKYTKGLGQEVLGVCAVEEDISSIALTVVSQLIRRMNLDLKTVGFLEVGSETLIDKSKSTKSVLMELFEASGNFDVEGVDVKNACFGGTAALFHAINWLESSSWDGRWALVVAADVAVYGTKAARPTGGAGAVAILLGPDAPLIFDRGFSNVLVTAHSNCTAENRLLPVDFLCFHSPFTRLVQKAYGWLALQDVECSRKVDIYNGYGTENNMVTGEQHAMHDSVDPKVTECLSKLTGNESPRDVDALCMQATAELFSTKVAPGLVFAKQVGNMYTASLYACLASLLLRSVKISFVSFVLFLSSNFTSRDSSRFPAHELWPLDDTRLFLLFIAHLLNNISVACFKSRFLVCFIRTFRRSFAHGAMHPGFDAAFLCVVTFICVFSFKRATRSEKGANQEKSTIK